MAEDKKQGGQIKHPSKINENTKGHKIESGYAQDSKYSKITTVTNKQEPIPTPAKPKR